MSGPALNPIANIAPAAPAKGTDATRQDASGTDSADATGKQGFASELHKQMNSDARKGDGAEADSKATAEADAAAAAPPDPQQAPTQPELAALLAGMMQTPPPPSTAASERAALRGDPAAGRDPLESTTADAALAALASGTGNTAPASGLAAADSAPNPAKLAAGLGDPTGTAARANAVELAGSAAGKAAELTGEISPTNSFANIHAAALANLRGEAPQAPAPSPVPLHVATPAGSAGWPEEVGSRVRWMVGNEESHAHLTLTPPQLGKVEVSISVNGDQTTAQFVAATPAARELIEQSLPRLREILEQSGINLGQTDVGTSGQSDNSGEGRRGGRSGGGRGGSDSLAMGSTPAQWVRRGEGLVDTFA